MSRALRHARGLAAAVGLLALAGCAKSPGAPAAVTAAPGTPVDSATVALWRMDETGGTRAADSGPHRLDATAGQDTRTSFGRFRNARIFGKSLNSFLYVPPSPLLDLGPAFTIECWLSPNSFSTYEDMTIAARWSPHDGRPQLDLRRGRRAGLLRSETPLAPLVRQQRAGGPPDVRLPAGGGGRPARLPLPDAARAGPLDPRGRDRATGRWCASG